MIHRLTFVMVALAMGLAGCSSSSDDEVLETSLVDQRAQSTGAVSGGDIAPGTRDGDIRIVRELPAPLDTATTGGTQPIALNDVLQVDVFQVDELDRVAQVDSRGMIALPLIGEVQAAGKSVRELEAEIEKLYGERYLQSPQVTVFVKESFGERVTVDGEVSKAGIYQTNATTSLIDVLAQAGGLTEIGDPSKIYVFRDIGSERLVANYDAKEIRQGRRSDPRIYGGDVIVVFASSSKVAMRNLREVFGVVRGGTALVPGL